MLIYRIESVDYLKDQDLFSKEYARVPPYRRKKIDALKRPEDKRLSLGAELLLEKVLREAGFHELAETRDIALTERGKPYIVQKTQDASKASVPYFCLSHSGERVMCALSDRPVGVDIEKADRGAKDCTVLARRFFSAAEAEAVEKAPDTFHKIWTLKEAYAKCLDIPLPEVLSKGDYDETLEQLQGFEDGYIWTVVYY